MSPSQIQYDALAQGSQISPGRPHIAADGAGLRYNEGKARWDLLPPDALGELAEVYTRGAAKYEPRNWERGMAWGKCFASLMRHAWAWWRGEELDSETGLHHMAHVAWNALALVAYSRRGIGEDDRQPLPTPKAEG